MNRRTVRKMLLHKTRKETTLIFVPHLHYENPTVLGTVPYHLNERGPGISVQEINNLPVLTFKGVRYTVLVYETEGQCKAIVGPWPLPKTRRRSEPIRIK